MRQAVTTQTPRPVVPVQIFPPRRDYASLSMKDLLDARDAHQVHLSMLPNVAATAVGRYLIHEKDWYATHHPGEPRPANFPRVKEPRTFMNSVIRPWSWPAVLVLVKKWEDAEKIGTDAVPRTLYLADGRVVPTCVVLAPPDEAPAPPPSGPFHSSPMLGGGYSCLREHQGEQGVGTFACLVRRGGTYYALTNRHVAGGDGEDVRAYIRGVYEKVGKTSDISIDRLPMTTAFPQWANSRLFLTLDAGLIRIDDINDWTSQAFGIGEVGEVYDATEQSITLDLIGCPLRAFGGTSGVSEGEIRALFYRYESVGGYEYATDVLIAPRKNDKKITADHPLTSHGDSGTLWFYDPPVKEAKHNGHADFENRDSQVDRGERARRLRPVAMQWGGVRLAMPDGSRSSFALATFLSTVCRALDIEVVRNWSIGHDEYWGKIGHFAVGWKACEMLDGSLASLMKKNQARIGFGNDRLSEGAAFRMGRGGFVPLGDVPDYVFVASKGIRPEEGSQHFADIDIYDIDGGKTLLQRCIDDPRNVAASVWKAYFDGFAAAGVGPSEGCLPFRVWQIWDAMVSYLRKQDVLRFVAAAGILSHYVSDASQPLHCSYLHHGIPPMKEVNGRGYPPPHDSEEYAALKKTRESKIHAIFDEAILEVDAATTLRTLDTQLARASKNKMKIESGHDAAVQTVRLMFNSQKRLPPMDIIKSDKPELGPKARAKELWSHENIRNATIAALADSTRLLAATWKAAWHIGGGDRIAKSKLVTLAESDLEKVYRCDRSFIPSLSLEAMAESGKFEP
ncbi:MAG: hypothetical protein LAP21_00060 [Acidobacteriia bacterium]|nr:hypothetical protein [Terriglobia bacterium]